MKNPYQAYSKASHTVSKTKQVVMLYDAVIRNMQQARVAMEEGRIEERYNKLVKAMDIVVGLQACLDFDQAEQASQVLYEFYSSVEMRMNTLHRTNDVAVCDELVEELKTMRAMWDRFDKGEEAGASEANAELTTSMEQLPEKPAEVVEPATETTPADQPPAAGGVIVSA